MQGFLISAEELEVLSEKLAVQLTKLDLTHSSGLTGSLSVLFTHSFPRLNKLIPEDCFLNSNDLQKVEGKLPQLRHLDVSWNNDVKVSDLFTNSFPTLNTLILSDCDLNSNDLQSLARANVEGKLPQLRHLDVSWNNDVKISDLFAHSAQWNQLTTFETADGNVLNVEPKCLISLEKLILRKLWGQ